jgi:hypothetical protein
MRSIVIPFLFCLTLWAVAAPREGTPEVFLQAPHPLAPGAFITVRVEGAPAATQSAFFDLGPAVRGLQLYPVGMGRWEGSFAVLPSMVGQRFQARAHLYGADRRPLAAPESESVVPVSSAAERQPGMISTTADGKVAVAFDQTIQLDSLEVRTMGGDEGRRRLQPELRNNYVVLPSSVEPGQVVSVRALTIHGQELLVWGPASSAMALQSSR